MGDLLSKVCNNIQIEPTLQPLSGGILPLQTNCRDSGARLDISAKAFWGDRFQKLFSTFEFSTLVQHLPDTVALKPITRKMNLKNKNMKNEFD